VIRLQRVETRRHKAGNPFVVPEESRVCQGREASRFMDARNHLFREGSETRNERRPASGEPAIKRLAGISRVPAGHQRVRDPRPAGGNSGIVNRRSQKFVRIEGDPERHQRIDHQSEAIDATPALLGQKRQ
jgi:hypothetical protein